MPSDEVIDLTVTDDEADAAAKRPRRARPADSDVVILDSDTAADPPSASMGDAEVQIVSARVEDWSEMAHTREQCRRHPFSAAMARGNASFCGACYCYVCDVPARDCAQWGSGSSRDHHCNAHSKNARHREARAAAAAARRGAQGGGSGAAAVPRPSGGPAASRQAPRAPAPAPASRPSGATATAPAARDAAYEAVIREVAANMERVRQQDARQDAREEAARLERAREQAARDRQRTEREMAAYREAQAMLHADLYGAGSSEEYWSDEYASDASGGHRFRGGCAYDVDDGGAGIRRILGMGGGRNRPWGVARPSAPVARPARPKACNFKAKPDPEADPDMFLLATVAFECEATAAGGSIADVAARLAPTGFFVPGRGAPNACYGDPVRVGLLRLVEDTYDDYGRTAAPLKLAPHRPPPPPPPPGPTRVRKLTLRFWDGRSLPVVHGITVPAETTVGGLLEAARQQLGADVCPPGACLVPHLLDSCAPVELGTVIKDEALANLRWSLAAHVQPPRPDADAADAAAPPSRKRRRGGAAAEPPPEVPIADVLVDLGMAMEAFPGDQNPRIMPLPCTQGRPPRLLLPLPEGAAATGGPATHAALARAAVAALGPYRRAPDDDDETQRLVAAVKLLYGPRPEYTRLSGQALVASGISQQRMAQYATAQYAGGAAGCPGSRPLRVCAVWGAADVEAAFDPGVWGATLTAPSAAPAALRPTEDHLAALRRHARATEEVGLLPRRLAREVESAAEEKDPAPPAPGQPVPVGPDVYAAAPALCRYKLALEAASRRAGEKKGTLRVAVYAWRASGPGHEGFFAAGHAFAGAEAGAGRGRGRRYGRLQRSVQPHRLELTLRTFLAEDPAFAALEERRRHWAAQDTALSHRRSIAALLEAMERPEAPAAPQPPGLSVTLRPYQRQSLQFMLEAEGGEGGFRRHLWAPATAADGATRFFYSPVLGRASQGMPAQPWGGFCCEEMGLGKTVEMLALCLANPAPPVAPGAKDAGGRFLSRATLVVCAVSLVGQWVAEAQEKTGGALRIYQYHGAGRLRDARRLAADFDVVVTTYATLSADCGNKKSRGGFNPAGTPLHSVRWHRLVLDESHTCKNPAVGHTKACVALEADRRWLCSGTPINTDIGDLYGQLAALRLAPWDQKAFFDGNARHAFGNNVFSGGCPELLHTLGAVMVRHTKRQELGGEAVLQLPPKTERLVPVALTAREAAAYGAVHARSAEIFGRYAALGPRFVSRSLLAIMALLLPMRRICSGGALLPRDLEVAEPDLAAAEASAAAEAAAAEAAGVGPGAFWGGGGAAEAPTAVDESLVAPGGEECAICMDAFEEPAVTSCGHWFCKVCIMGALSQAGARCPLCRARQRANQLRLGVTAGEAAARAAAAAAAAGAGPSAAPGAPSQEAAEAEAAEAAAAAAEAAAAATTGGLIAESKLEALLRELRAMRRADPTAKALVFSQYNSTIEWLKGRLSRSGFGHRHISGSMPLKQRAAAIAAFQGDPPTTVFLLSMRSGAVGINLTAATHVFLLEPALNPALEEQAIGRAWRMGQRRPVTVLRFYVQGSVEERIMTVAKARHGGVAGGAAAAAADGILGPGAFLPPAMGGGGGRGGRPVRVEDQAGSIKEDRQNLRLGELQELFAAPELPPPRAEGAEAEDEEVEEEEAGGSGSGGGGAAAPRRPSAEGGAGPSGAAPAAAARSRMRRSKAGMAAMAAGTPRPASAGGSGGGGAGPSATPAATLPGAPPSGTGPAPQSAPMPPPPPAQQQQQQQERRQKPAAGAAAAVEGEPEEEAPPADILARIRGLAGRATGRLTPAESSDASAAAVAAAKRGPSRAGAEAAAGGARGGSLGAALASHLPRPTPDAAGGALASRRPHRRVPRLNYAALVGGETEAEASAAAGGSGDGDWTAGEMEAEEAEETLDEAVEEGSDDEEYEEYEEDMED